MAARDADSGRRRAMRPQTDVTVVVVTHDNERIIERCLVAVREAIRRYVYEVIVVDNGSSDATVTRARSQPGVEVVELKRNTGFAAANNVGIRRAEGRYVALVNSDAFPRPGAIDRLVERAEADPSIGLVGGRLWEPSGRLQASAGRFPSLLGNLWLALFAHRLPLLSRVGVAIYTHPRFYRHPRPVDWVSGAFCLARREVGPLPEDAFMFGEDVEWAHAVRRAGLEVWLEPSASALHLTGATVDAAQAPGFREASRAEFELRWFARRGSVFVLSARAVLGIHALVRLVLYLGLLPFRRGASERKLRGFAELLRYAVSGRSGSGG